MICSVFYFEFLVGIPLWCLLVFESLGWLLVSLLIVLVSWFGLNYACVKLFVLRGGDFAFAWVGVMFCLLAVYIVWY